VYKLRPKTNAPPTFSHGEIRWSEHRFKDHNYGKYYNHKFDQKKPHPSSPLERMGGVIIIINEVQWLCHLHQYVHEVQHLHLHSLTLAME